MKYNPEKHYRKSIRLKGRDYSQSGVYFVTICTRDRECIFGDVRNKQMILNRNGKIARQCWHELSKTFSNIKTPAFVVMPNHIHGIIIFQHQVQRYQSGENSGEDRYDDMGLINQTPTTDLVQQPGWILMKSKAVSLGKIIRHYKAQVTTMIRKNSAAHFQWQRNYYDEFIQDSRELEQKHKYIINNPSAWENDEENPKNKKNFASYPFKSNIKVQD